MIFVNRLVWNPDNAVVLCTFSFCYYFCSTTSDTFVILPYAEKLYTLIHFSILFTFYTGHKNCQLKINYKFDRHTLKLNSRSNSTHSHDRINSVLHFSFFLLYFNRGLCFSCYFLLINFVVLLAAFCDFSMAILFF